jgi:hypothetical protein
MSLRIHTLLPLLLLAGLPFTRPAAQVVHSLWHADHVGYRLPGTVPEEGFVLSLPSYGMGVYNSGFSYNDLVVSSTNNVYRFDVEGVLAKLKDENTLAIGGGLQTIGVGWKMKNLFFEVGHQVRFENFLFYPRDLFGVFFQGNAPYIGQTANLGLKVQSFNYSEIYAGAALQLEKISLGARLKYLNGAVAAQTERSRLDLYTSDDVYQLTLNSDYLLYTSPELDILKGEDTDLQIGLGDYSLRKMLSRNMGLALDLGASVMLGEKFRIDAAVIDLGRITWKDDVIGYQSNKTVQYDGFQFSSLFSDDSLSLVGALDTLEELLAFEEVEGRNFTTQLPWYFQVGGRYTLTDWVNVSAMYFGQQRAGNMYSGISLGANFSLARVIEAGITYSIFEQTYSNIGLHGLLRLGPVRIYAASDNIISLFTLNDSRYANGRAGLQIAF